MHILIRPIYSRLEKAQDIRSGNKSRGREFHHMLTQQKRMLPCAKLSYIPTVIVKDQCFISKIPKSEVSKLGSIMGTFKTWTLAQSLISEPIVL